MNQIKIQEIMQFKGTWRSYQKRVLDQAQRYMKDRKIHIVAPPGSGKTTLGIELIRRVGQPCLILSPSIVIRQQWLERIREAFLAEGTGEGVLSEDIRRPGAVTAITYQALHAAVKRLGQGEEETDDYSGFDLLKTVRRAGIKTICLDECHHLRNEWWRALETFMAELGDVFVVSLTATPPYDSTPAQWERYIGMCGEIDEEIMVPELVREKSLCPHQDYVYFNYPSAGEEAQIKACRSDMQRLCAETLADSRFSAVIATHRGIRDPKAWADRLLESPAYLASILIFMEREHLPYPRRWLKLLGVKKLPQMQEKHLEQLLQGALFEDADSYAWDEKYRAELTGALKRIGCIENRTVSLSASGAVNKLLTNSLGKLNSIEEIVRAEHTSLGRELRLLILTDFIRSEYLETIGKEEAAISKIGVIPLFEQLRRSLPGELRLGVLCGSVIILPSEAVACLQEALKDRGSAVAAELRGGGEPTGYSRVTIRGNQQAGVRAVTEVFEAGWVNVLIGTKALLGEGWDSPCINALILASFVGSFVLSNQMRGRAIRFSAANPQKTSNIWHLVCLESDKWSKARRRLGVEEGELSEDFAMLSRRMEGFLGLDYTGTTIESGIDRLGLFDRRYTGQGVQEINREMLDRAADRSGLCEKWEQAMVVYEGMEVVDETGVQQQTLKPGAAFYDQLGRLVINAVCGFLMLGLLVRAVTAGGGILSLLFTGVLSAATLILTGRYGAKVAGQLTPLKRLKSVGQGIKDALVRSGQITPSCNVMVEESRELQYFIYLTGGTVREKSLFSDCIQEFYGLVDNQRYLLCSSRGPNGRQDYFCVPALFSKNKDAAEQFRQSMSRRIGSCQLVYTRNEEGRSQLLKARKTAYANQADMAGSLLNGRRKKVRRALE